jgi:putative GTP pyrophosphokinase
MSEELNEFLVRNRIDRDIWEQSKCDWNVLSEIYADHAAQSQMLAESAALYASLIQKLPGVHSVRWRVKDGEHLLEKIIRKKAASEEKYETISATNYFEIVTDLIGIRALHLFKDDCFNINSSLTAIWAPTEKPVAYIRNGDPDELIAKYGQHNLEVKVHPAGYRSVHYVISSQPINRRVYAEVQIRTIFEEGWSEIDHKIRYPNFSDNELVGYFLTIFNRMAGSADEMGSFVRGLAASIQDYKLQVSEASSERDESLKKMEALIAQLGQLKQQDKESKAAIGKLQEQLGKMKNERTIEQIFSSRSSSSELNKLLQGTARANLFRDIDNASSALKRFETLSASSQLAKLMIKKDSTKK